ncbi:MAG: tetratricopeptide repeat protein, partial [Planctomycetota bacterium]
MPMPVPANTSLEVALETARTQLRGGQLHAAVGTLIAAEPHHPRAVLIPRTLGEIYASCGHGPAAIECLRRALAIAPEEPALHGLLATAFVVAHDLETARKTCHEALDRFPDHAALHSALGLVEQTAGNKPAAIAALRRALELDEVGQCLAAYRLSRLGVDLDLDRMEHVVERLPRNAPEESWRALHFAIAEIADRRGEYPRAFQHMLAGNRHSELGVYKPELEVERATAIVATFTERFFAERKQVGHRGVRPVFVVSLPRSGTSLLEQ